MRMSSIHQVNQNVNIYSLNVCVDAINVMGLSCYCILLPSNCNSYSIH